MRLVRLLELLLDKQRLLLLDERLDRLDLVSGSREGLHVTRLLGLLFTLNHGGVKHRKLHLALSLLHLSLSDVLIKSLLHVAVKGWVHRVAQTELMLAVGLTCPEVVDRLVHLLLWLLHVLRL